MHPLGTDLGVVTGRMAELRLLRRPALLGLAIVVIGVLIAGAEAVAYRESTALMRGLVVRARSSPSPAVSRPTRWSAAPIQGVVLATVVALLPGWTDLPPTRLRFGPAAGVALAAATLAGRTVILGAGGWLPVTSPVPANTGWELQLADAWLPALVEEPLLRGALPAFAAPMLGWWGAALLAAPVGALLHPGPAVPLLASIGLEVMLQIGLAVVARFAGVGGAVLARGTCEALVQRASFPVGLGVGPRRPSRRGGRNGVAAMAARARLNALSAAAALALAAAALWVPATPPEPPASQPPAAAAALAEEDAAFPGSSLGQGSRLGAGGTTAGP